MADISKIKLPNGSEYDLKDASKVGVYIVKGTQTKSTASWTGNINIPALYDGLTIAYYLPYAGTSTSATLKLTLSDNSQTAAIPVYYTATSRATTQYGAGSTIILTYWSAGSISVTGTATDSDRWTRADYNTNSDTKVRQTLSSSDVNHPLLMAYSANTTTTGNVDNVSYRNNSIFANPSTGKITANGFVGNVEGMINNHTVNADVPTDAAFTDTTYSLATTASDGLMSSADKLKLSRIGSAYDNSTETLTLSLDGSSIEHYVSDSYFSFALLKCLRNLAWINNQGQTCYDDLYNVLYQNYSAYITAEYTQNRVIYEIDSLDILKQDLIVKFYENGSSGVVISSDNYTLSGTLIAGEVSILVSYNGLLTTFNVNVTSAPQFNGQYFGASTYDAKLLQYDTGVTYNTNTNTGDMVFGAASGEHQPFVKGNGTHTFTIYPIKVPDTATSVIVDLKGQAYQPLLLIWNTEKTNKWWRVSPNTWPTTKTIINLSDYSQYEGPFYFAVSCGGSSYSMDKSNWFIGYGESAE